MTASTINKVYMPELLKGQVVRIVTRLRPTITGTVSYIWDSRIGIVPTTMSSVFWYWWNEIESIEIGRMTYEPITVALNGVADESQ